MSGKPNSQVGQALEQLRASRLAIAEKVQPLKQRCSKYNKACDHLYEKRWWYIGALATGCGFVATRLLIGRSKTRVVHVTAPATAAVAVQGKNSLLKSALKIGFNLAKTPLQTWLASELAKRANRNGTSR